MTVLTFSSCDAHEERQEEVAAEDYEGWVDKNKEKVKRTTTFKKSNLEFSVRYLPNGMQGGEAQKGSTFLYEIKGLKGGDPLAYHLKGSSKEQRINYLSSQIEDDVLLVDEGGDTIRPENALFERTYGVTPFVRVLFSFGKECEQAPEAVTLLVNEKIYGFGIMKYHFDKEFFTKLPKVVEHDK